MVKRLAEFDGVEGVTVAARILRPIGRLVRGRDGIGLEGKSVLEYFGELMGKAPTDVYELMAVLSGEDPKTFHCTGGEALSNLAVMVGDPDLMSFFGLRRQTQESFTSAQENTEGPETSGASSDTVKQDSKKN